VHLLAAGWVGSVHEEEPRLFQRVRVNAGGGLGKEIEGDKKGEVYVGMESWSGTIVFRQP